MFASNRTALNSKTFCAMSCTTFVGGILSGTGFAVVCRALLFFHPAAWYAVRRMQFDRELACDLAAVSDSPKGRAKYAECLIHFARLNSAQNSRNWGIDFAASSEHLKVRVHSILAGSKKPSAWLAWSRIACGVALLAGFLGIEPSLGVLLTYARQQISQPLTPEALATTSSKTGTKARVTRRGRVSVGFSPHQRGYRGGQLERNFSAHGFLRREQDGRFFFSAEQCGPAPAPSRHARFWERRQAADSGSDRRCVRDKRLRAETTMASRPCSKPPLRPRVYISGCRFSIAARAASPQAGSPALFLLAD